MKKRRIVSLLLAAAILAAALTGCANLKVGLMLLQHATGPYDPMDQVMEDRLNAILEAAVAQDAAAIKAQFAPNAIAVQPELDSQIEALFDYYDSENGEIDNISGRAGSASDGAGGKNRYYEMSGKSYQVKCILSIYAQSQRIQMIRITLVFGRCSCAARPMKQTILMD